MIAVKRTSLLFGILYGAVLFGEERLACEPGGRDVDGGRGGVDCGRVTGWCDANRGRSMGIACGSGHLTAGLRPRLRRLAVTLRERTVVGLCGSRR